MGSLDLIRHNGAAKELDLAVASLHSRVRTALEREPADLVLRNVQLVNVYAEEIHLADVVVRDRSVVAIREAFGGEARKDVDASGLYVAPGLIEPSARAGDTLGTGTTFSFGPSDTLTVDWHDCPTVDVLLDGLRDGKMLLLAEGAGREPLLSILGELIRRDLDLRHVCLSGGESGRLDLAVVTAIRAGLPPARAFQLATLNPAAVYAHDHRIGSVAPGRQADLLVLQAPDALPPLAVLRAGHVVAGALPKAAAR